MDLLIPASIIEELQRELKTAGRSEIGGLLFGEHVGGGVFRIVEISVQRDGGTNAHFVRDPAQHREQLEAVLQQNRKCLLTLQLPWGMALTPKLLGHSKSRR